jgi:DNA-binding NarL/FixJ family response regulator
LLGDLGFNAFETPSLVEWKPGRGAAAVVAWAEGESAQSEIAAFAESHPLIPLVAILSDLDLAGVAMLLRAGAWGAVDAADPAETLGEALSSALADRVSMPRQIAAAMAGRIPTITAVDQWVSAEQAAWLRELASGRTVAALSEQIGYSERETFRMLGELYASLGVKSRTEAIIWAARHGVLD